MWVEKAERFRRKYNDTVLASMYRMVRATSEAGHEAADMADISRASNVARILCPMHI